MTRYFLGVDSGGTKTHALIADESGQAIYLATGGPGNQESIGYDRLALLLESVISEACRGASIDRHQLIGAGFGNAGYDWNADIAPHREIIDALLPGVPYEIVNDAVVGLLAGSSTGWGVAVVAGTGCNCWGRDAQGRLGRVTGEGIGMGEFGGASELVHRAIQQISIAWSKRGPETRLAEALMDYVGETDVERFLEGICRRRFRVPPAAAPLIFQVADEGDAVAQECLRWSGRELGSLAVGVIRQLQFEALEFEVVMSGSLHKGGGLMTDSLKETVRAVAPRARFVRLTAPPVAGGIFLAMQAAGLSHLPMRDRLIESTAQLVAENV